MPLFHRCTWPAMLGVSFVCSRSDAVGATGHSIQNDMRRSPRTLTLNLDQAASRPHTHALHPGGCRASSHTNMTNMPNFHALADQME